MRAPHSAPASPTTRPGLMPPWRSVSSSMPQRRSGSRAGRGGCRSAGSARRVVGEADAVALEDEEVRAAMRSGPERVVRLAEEQVGVRRIDLDEVVAQAARRVERACCRPCRSRAAPRAGTRCRARSASTACDLVEAEALRSATCQRPSSALLLDRASCSPSRGRPRARIEALDELLDADELRDGSTLSGRWLMPRNSQPTRRRGRASRRAGTRARARASASARARARAGVGNGESGARRRLRATASEGVAAAVMTRTSVRCRSRGRRARVASAMIVSIGLTPIGVGNSDASATIRRSAS